MSLPLPKAEGWRKLVSTEREKPYFQKLESFLRAEAATGHIVFPPEPLIFSAFDEVDCDATQVVILGQDPYHGPGQAIGRSFAVPNSLPSKPPSLLNIFKELESDLGVTLPPLQSDLSGWTQQGVLLLNAVLTVRAHSPWSHRDQGWETFTDHALELLAQRSEPLVFFLWGAQAQKKVPLIREWQSKAGANHLILEAPHPSPLSAYRGFFGCKHFSRANSFLKKPIDWTQLCMTC